MISPGITTNLRTRVSKKEVRLHDLKPTESIGSSVTGKVCLVCTVNVSSYCCPQCFIPYCSSNCYLKHGVECTEAFSRQRVKSVLDLETKERATDTTVDLPDQRVYGNFRDGKEFHDRENGREDFSDRLLEDADESDTDVLETEIADCDDPALISEMKRLDFSADNMDLENLKKMSSSVLARLVKLWTPWWLSSESQETSKLELSSLSIKKRGISSSIAEIARTAPRLRTLIPLGKLSKDVGYQTLGLILGYVVTMHSLNGDWQECSSECSAEEHSSVIVPLNNFEKTFQKRSTDLIKPLECSSECSNDPNGEGRFEALNLICQSSPILDTQFRPCSVIQTIESWIRFRPLSLQNISRKKLKSILIDAFSILKFSEFLSFSLLEVWLISISCDSSDKKISTMTEKVRKCLKDENYGSFVDEILPLMDLYGEKFGSKIPKKQKNDPKNKNNNSFDTIQADLMARKSFFLFLYTLDPNHVEVLRNLAEELQEYVRTYID